MRAIAAATVAAVVSADGTLPSLRAKIEVAKPAVAVLSAQFAEPALLVTTFNGPFTKDPVYLVQELPGILAGGAANTTVLNDGMHWVNFIAPVPEDAVAESDGHQLVLAAGGFLVPTKSPGTVDLLDATDLSHVTRQTLSTSKSGYFYHDAIWADINKDGRADVLTARATQPLVFGKKGGELVWLEQPQSGALGNETWEEHVLTSGPDVAILFADLDGDGTEELVATQFFSAPELRVYWCDKPSWAECNTDDGSISSRLIDGGEDGPWFNLEKVDLDLDGSDELLVTSNRDDGKGSLFAFEIPSDFKQGNWTKHVLATGYVPAKKGTGKGAPGTARSFHARTADAGKRKPLILLTGDDAGFVDILQASSTDAGNFAYTSERLTQSESHGTIGTPCVGDVDGDGAVEVFVPMYSDNRIEVYSYSPTH